MKIQGKESAGIHEEPQMVLRILSEIHQYRYSVPESDNTRDYAFPGIGVNIFPLRTPAASVKAERRLSRDENAWTELCHINYADRNFRSRVNRTIMRLQCMITGRQGQAAHLYDRLVRSCQQPGANKYILKRRKQTTVFPAEIFAQSKRVTLEGAELQVPAKLQSILP